ncbi:MAG: hypothetical protein COA36_05665 [Desulfotalea sp.]|nr:MAG: hypothetical protein COA36_05665 [Desulfotalea sp.]
MSYILEALKKSKQERQGSDSLHLHIVHGAPSGKPRFRISLSRGVCAGLAVVILSAGAFVSFYTVTKVSSGTAAPSRRISVRPIEIRSKSFVPVGRGADLAQGSALMAAITTESDETSPRATFAKDKIKKVFFDSSQGIGPASSSKEFSLIKYRGQLPVEIQQVLPQFVFAGHTYADNPKQRLIIINNAILREGQSVDVNTRLLHIIWEGVVLDYKGIVFKQKIH